MKIIENRHTAAEPRNTDHRKAAADPREASQAQRTAEVHHVEH
jgi:hypothetical protein